MNIPKLTNIFKKTLAIGGVVTLAGLGTGTVLFVGAFAAGGAMGIAADNLAGLPPETYEFLFGEKGSVRAHMTGWGMIASMGAATMWGGSYALKRIYNNRAAKDRLQAIAEATQKDGGIEAMLQAHDIHFRNFLERKTYEEVPPGDILKQFSRMAENDELKRVWLEKFLVGSLYNEKYKETATWPSYEERGKKQLIEALKDLRTKLPDTGNRLINLIYKDFRQQDKPLSKWFQKEIQDKILRPATP